MNQILQLISEYLKKLNPNLISKELSESVNISGEFSSENLKELVVKGDWNEILGKLEKFSDTDDEVMESIFRVIEEKINENISNGRQCDALEILRNELSPICRNSEKIHQLARNIIVNQAELGKRIDLAEELIDKLKTVSGLLIREDRLEELIGQAVKYQKMTKCPFHFEREGDEMGNLWFDHDCKVKERIIINCEESDGLVTVGDVLKIFSSIDGEEFGGLSDTEDVFKFNKGWELLSKSHHCGATMTIWPKRLVTFPEFLQNGQISFESILIESPLAICFMPNQNYVICSFKDQTTTLFDIKAGRPVHSWIRLRCSHLVTDKDGFFLALTDSNSILQISTETFQVIRTIPAAVSATNSMASSVDLDENRLLIGYNDSTLYYYDDWQQYPHPTRIFRGHLCETTQSCALLSRFHSDLVISCSESGSIFVWNVWSGRIIFEVKVSADGGVNDLIEVGVMNFIAACDGGKIVSINLWEKREK